MEGKMNRLTLVVVSLLMITCIMFSQHKRNVTDLAYDNMYFGDDYTAFRKNSSDLFVDVGDYKYYLDGNFTKNTVETSYDLYQLVFESYRQTANCYDTRIRVYWENLINVISRKYGNKSGKFPSFLSLGSDGFYPTHVWIKGKKRIEIGIQLRDSQYQAVLMITDTKRERALKTQEDHESNEQIRSDSKKF
jgi:hypothetical protein